ncbi:MAG: hypothetical protein Kow0098_27200 [Ignavibacteriaceae bacterium]
MKNQLFGILLSFLIVSAVFAGAYLEYFYAHSEGESIKLEWKTGEETNLSHFVIERRTPDAGFIEIDQLPAQGSNSYYSYIDDSAYRVNDLVFIYRLKIVDNDNQISYSAEVTVSHSISGVKRTWGSIKAMFR